jgi:hypothetical protein
MPCWTARARPADEFNARVDDFWREIEQPTTSPEQPAHTA